MLKTTIARDIFTFQFSIYQLQEIMLVSYLLLRFIGIVETRLECIDGSSERRLHH